MCERRRVRPAVERLDANQMSSGVRLRVFDEDVEVPVLVEYARVEQLVLRTLPGAPLVFRDQRS